MSAKSQHNNVLLAILGFTTVVVVVGIIGFFAFSHEKENIQGQVEVSEYRVARFLDVFLKFVSKRGIMSKWVIHSLF